MGQSHYICIPNRLHSTTKQLWGSDFHKGSGAQCTSSKFHTYIINLLNYITEICLQ
jgi:hypothetical protein